MRNTKKINVSLRELDDPTDMDVENYDMKIVDRNMQLRWDNSVDESMGPVVYQPHDTWNTDDRTPVRAASDGTGGRDGQDSPCGLHDIPYHVPRGSGGRWCVVHYGQAQRQRNRTGELARHVVPPAQFGGNLPLLASGISGQGYDYQMDFFLKGGELAYVNIGISVLNWSVRVQFEEL